jgi:hypothetical protein
MTTYPEFLIPQVETIPPRFMPQTFSRRNAMTANDQRQSLSEIAILCNRLAHLSTGQLRAWALRTKVSAVGELIVRGWATANSKRPNGTVGINIDDKPRLHVPLNLLEPEARARAQEQTRTIRATAPLREYLDFAELESLSVASPK